MNKGRIFWVDYVKVISIICMVLCHAGMSGIPAQIIYQFHMPAFFIVSGYLYKERNLINEIKVFLIPVVTFIIINYIAGIVLEIIPLYFSETVLSLDMISYTKKCLLPLYHKNDGSSITLFTGLWFLIALLCSKILLRGILNKYKVYIAILCIVYTSLQNQIFHLKA